MRASHTRHWALQLLPLAGLGLVVFGGFLVAQGVRGSGRLTALTAPSRNPVQVRILRPRPVDGRLTPYGLVAEYLRRRLDEQLLNHRLPFKVEPTTGSHHTLSELDNAENRQVIGITQADVLFHYVHGQHPQFAVTHANSSARAVARLFEEWLLVRARKTTGPEHHALIVDQQLLLPRTAREACVSGAVGSGSAVTATALATAAQLPWRHNVHACGSAALDFSVLSPPALPSTGDFRHVALDQSTARVLAGALPAVYRFVPPDELSLQYPEIPDGRATVAVNAILVANRWTDRVVVEHVRCVVQELDASLCQRSEALTSSCLAMGYNDSAAAGPNSDLLSAIRRETRFCQTPATRFDGLPIASHTASVVARLDPISTFLVSISFRILQGLLLSVVGAAALVVGIPRVIPQQIATRLPSFLRRYYRRWFTLLAIFVLLHLVVAMVVWIGEFHSEAIDVNSSFVAAGMAGALRWVFDFVATGSSSVDLRSIPALVAVGALKAGWGLATVSITVVVAGKLRSAIMAEMRKNHFVIIGAGEHARIVHEELSQIVEAEGKNPREFVQLVRTEQPDGKDLNEAIADAHPETAKRVIILAIAHGERPEAVDLKTLQSLTNLRQIYSKAPLVVELLQAASVPIAKALGADVVCADWLSARLVAHEAAKRGLAALFQELLEQEPKISNEVYYDKLGDQDRRHKTFGRLAAEWVQRANLRIPVGVIEHGKPSFNPGCDHPLNEVEEIVVIARDPLHEETPDSSNS